MTMYYYVASRSCHGLRLSLSIGFNRSLFIVGSNKFANVSSMQCNNQIFSPQHRSSSSMNSVVDSAPPIIQTTTLAKSPKSPRILKISKAMKAYLERAKAHEDFIKEKDVEFEIGKRHLANMMGLDAESFTQEDIDKAIQYLMPSGLYEKKARPMMKSPKELYPKEKAAQFEASGRPFSCFFYTCKSNFYETMHEVVDKFIELDAFEDKMLRRGINEPPEELVLQMGGSEWLNIDQAKALFLENLTETEYMFMIDTLDRLCAHPYSFRCKDFIFKFREIFADITELETVPELIQDETGRVYMTAESRRKTANAKVTVWGNGSGKVKINDFDISYFHAVQHREQVMHPLQFTGLLGQVDIEATVTGEGPSADAGAIRHALSLCLRSFVAPEEVERMRLAGLLTRDKRKRERKKPGQKGARAKFTWRKR